MNAKIKNYDRKQLNKAEDALVVALNNCVKAELLFTGCTEKQAADAVLAFSRGVAREIKRNGKFF